MASAGSLKLQKQGQLAACYDWGQNAEAQPVLQDVALWRQLAGSGFKIDCACMCAGAS